MYTWRYGAHHMLGDPYLSHQVAVVIAVTLLVSLHLHRGLPQQGGEPTKTPLPPPAYHSASLPSKVLIEVFVVRKTDWPDMTVFIKVYLFSELHKGEIKVHFFWFELRVVKYTHHGSLLHLVYVIRSQ